jgi:hypothetical protein
VKRLIAVLTFSVVATLVVAYAGVWNRAVAFAQGSPQSSVYFGFLLGTPTIGAVAFDLSAPDAQGNRILRAYVCDGLGPPEGMAIWFKGDLEKTAFSDGTDVMLTSAGGRESLRVTALSTTGVYGAFTDANGVTAHFVSYPAFDGAGIYQVTLDELLHYKGTSTDGATLDAQATEDGVTNGAITTAGGKKIEFTVRSLALADPAALARHGLSDAYKKYAADNQVPGEYVAVIAPGGTHWFGRNGSVREGQPGRAIIGLDKKEKK